MNNLKIFKQMKKIVFYSVAFLLLLVASVFIRGRYIQWTFNKNLINEVIDYPVIFQNATHVIDVSQLEDKFVFLYCWDSNCTDRDMAEFQKIFDTRLKQDSRINLYAIFCYSDTEDDSLNMSDVIEKDGDIFTAEFSLNKSDNVLKQLKTDSWPTALVVNKERNIIFRGSVSLAIKYMLASTYIL